MLKFLAAGNVYSFHEKESNSAFLAANDIPSLCMKKKSTYQMLPSYLPFFLKIFFLGK